MEVLSCRSMFRFGILHIALPPYLSVPGTRCFIFFDTRTVLDLACLLV